MAIAPSLEAQASDYDTDIAPDAEEQAIITGTELRNHIEEPSTIYVSPYKRTRKTLGGLLKGWPTLAKAKILEEDRIREQEFGKSICYSDWRLYFAFHPDQALLNKRSTIYDYKYDQGESFLDVRERVRSFISTLIREHGGHNKEPENVLVITHHLVIMAMRANIERWTREEFLRRNENERPSNCSVTTYEGIRTSSDRSPQGREGRLILRHSNLILYKE